MVVCSGESTGYGDAAGPDPGSQWYRNLSVVGGPQAIAAPFTKWSNAAADVSVLYGMLKRAGELAAQAPAGPVYVNTPVEVLLAPWQPAATAPVPVAVGGSTVAVPEDVELAVRLLAAARGRCSRWRPPGVTRRRSRPWSSSPSSWRCRWSSRSPR